MGLVLFAAGCVVVARPAPRPPTPGVVVYGPPLEYGFRPLLYQGYVVYYTDDGIPYYWLGGRQVWLPAAERAYYVRYWRQHRQAYRKWYRHRGHVYRGRRYRPKKARKHHYQPAPRLKKVEPYQPAPRLKKVKKRKLKKVEEEQRPHLEKVD
ncbi:MAG: hypothetical protein DRI34_05530 [Deltaproteobacteria bacterium]|nr:MAG: hypothetical protein DRI34_05530 [Deltaproteobacteria bacterium]